MNIEIIDQEHPDFALSGVTAVEQQVDLSEIQQRQSVDLVRTLRDHTADIDERFDAALILRDREKSPAMMKHLFRLVVASTLPVRNVDELDGDRFQTEKLGKMAAIALQGQITSTEEYIDTLTTWIEEGIELSIVERDEKFLLDTARQIDEAERGGLWLPQSAEAQPLELSHAELQKREQTHNRLARALLLLANAEPGYAHHLLANTLNSPVDSSMKVFAANGLAGVESELVAEAFAALLDLKELPDQVFSHMLTVLNHYCPDGGRLREELTALKGASEKASRFSELSMQSARSQGFDSLSELFGSILSQPATSERALAARQLFSAECWRPLMHLHHPHSLFTDVGADYLVETRPAGSLSDLTFSKRVHMR